MTEIAECKYYLPCGLCELSHERCKQHEVLGSTYEPVECDHDWIVTKRLEFPLRHFVELQTNYRCIKCGKTKSETKEFTYDEYKEKCQ